MLAKLSAVGFPGWLILMGAVTALGPFSVDLNLPAFPAMALGLAVPRGEIERTMAAYLLGLAMSQAFYGPFADRYGRKPTLLAGLALYMVGALGCALSPSVQVLTAFRVLQAIGGSAGVVVPRAVIRDHYDTQQAAHALSLLMLIMGLAPILAPLIGGQLLLLTGWRGIFWMMMSVAALLAVLAIFIMKESLAPDRAIALRLGTIIKNYRELLSHRRFLAHSLAGGLGQAGMFAYIVASPQLFIESYGVSPQSYGFLFGLNAAGLIIGSQINARLLRRHTPAPLQRAAQRFLAIAGIAAVTLTVCGFMTLPLLMACLIGYMTSQGFVNPNSAALALAEQGKRLGAASALLGTLQYSCGAIAGLLVSIWETDSALPLTGVLALCACLSWACGRIARKEDLILAPKTV